MTSVIFETGGKQFRVQEGDVIRVEKLAGEQGAEVSLDQVLLVSSEAGITVGKPVVKGAKVRARILRQDRDKKIEIFKYKRRKGYTRRRGHRQSFTELKIEKIETA